MTKGAGSRSADEIAETIERVGGSLSAAAGPDFLSVSASVLTTDRELAFELVADALLRPTFPADELDLLRTQTLSALALARSQPDAIAGRMFAKHIYGDAPVWPSRRRNQRARHHACGPNRVPSPARAAGAGLVGAGRRHRQHRGAPARAARSAVGRGAVR